MNKKGFFFTIDAFIAIGIALVGILLFLSYYYISPSTAQSFYYSQDILRTLSETQIYEFNVNNHPYLKKLKSNGNITNIEQSLLQQIGEFYYRSLNGCSFCLDMAYNFTQNITYGILSERFQYRILLDGVEIFEKNSSLPTISNDVNNATIVFSSKLLVSGMYNYSEFYGPYNAEVIVVR